MNIQNKIPKIRNGIKVRPEVFGCLIFTNRTPILSFNMDSYTLWKYIDGSSTIAELCEKNKISLDDNILSFFQYCNQLDLIEYI